MFSRQSSTGAAFLKIDVSPLIGLLCALLALFALSSHDLVDTKLTQVHFWGDCFCMPPYRLVMESSTVFYWEGKQIDRVKLLARLDRLAQMHEDRGVVVFPKKTVAFDQLVNLLQQLDARSIGRSVE